MFVVQLPGHQLLSRESEHLYPLELPMPEAAASYKEERVSGMQNPPWVAHSTAEQTTASASGLSPGAAASEPAPLFPAQTIVCVCVPAENQCRHDIQDRVADIVSRPRRGHRLQRWEDCNGASQIV
jgi:hypothetical protein